MAGRIPDDFIDMIRFQADIVDVISDYVTLKKGGKNYLGLCPFHNEKTPSFNVNPDRQTFHCFGCGKGGNVFTFLMEHEKVTFIEAVQQIAAKLNIAIPETGRERNADASSEHESLYRVTQFATKFFQEQLLASKGDSVVKQYIERRGLSNITMTHFMLGYAPDSWDALLRAAESQGITQEWLQKAGLAGSKGDRFYDVFRHRLIFPIFSVSGRVIGFGGRALTDDAQPKYLNSPETAIYQKSRIVYGLSHTKDTVRRAGRVIIVEGYMDLLSLYQAEVEHVVATCGTALTVDQARLLARFAQDAVLVYDADNAGVRATMRGLEPLVEAGLWTRVVQLPVGEDPDTYVRQHHKAGFLERMERASTIADFIAGQFDLSSSSERETALETLANIINKTGNLRHRERYLEEAEQRLRVPQSLLAPALRPTRGSRTAQAAPPTPPPSRFEDPEREITRLLLYDAEIALIVEEQLHPDDFINPVYRVIVQQRLEGLNGDRPADPASLIDQTTDAEIARAISELSAAEDTGTDRTRRAWDYIKRIKQEQLKRERVRIQQRLAQAQTDQDEPALQAAMEEWQRLLNLEQALKKVGVKEKNT